MPTEDEKTQRIIAEKRHNDLMALLTDIKNILLELVVLEKNEIVTEKIEEADGK